MRLRAVDPSVGFDGRHRLSGEPIYFPSLVERDQSPVAGLVPVVDQTGLAGWRLAQAPAGLADLFFATGREKPDTQLVDMALRTVRMLALDQDTYSITIETRCVSGRRDPVIDVYIGR